MLSARYENPIDEFDEENPYCYELVFVEQLPLNISYVDIVAYVEAFVQQKQLAGRVQIVADCTGVGKAVLDLMRSSPVLTDLTWSIVFTSGQNVTQQGMIYKVPKKDLIAAVLVLTGKDLIRCNPELPDAEKLRKEMLGYIMRRTTAGNNTFDGEFKTHDDMVVALCMVCWIGGKLPIDLSMSQGEGRFGGNCPAKTSGGSPLITRETGGVNLGFERPPR